MTTYLYPQNLKATANLWLWSLKDFCYPGHCRPAFHRYAGTAKVFVPVCGNTVFRLSHHSHGRYHSPRFSEISLRGILSAHNSTMNGNNRELL